MPSRIRPAAASVGEPLICRTPPLSFGTPSASRCCDQALGDRLADALVVERDVVVGRHVRDRAVVGDDLDVLALGELHQRGGGARVDRVEDDHLGALGDHRVELLLLQRDVGVGVLVDHLAVGAELRHLGLEAGEVVLLVAGRALVGHQEGHGAALRAARRQRREASPRASAPRPSGRSWSTCVSSVAPPASGAGEFRESGPRGPPYPGAGPSERRDRLPFRRAQACARGEVAGEERPEPRRRHALVLQELPVEVREVVEARGVADLGDRAGPRRSSAAGRRG